MRPINRLRYSIILMIVMVMALGTVTYAWISLSTINNIEGLSLSATTGDELEISIDGINYASRLNTEELQDLFGDVKLIDVTSRDGIYFELGGLRDVGEAIANQDYLSFDLYFRTVEAEHYVYLINNVSDQVSYDISASGTYVVSNGMTWVNRTGFMNGPLTTDYIEPGTEDRYYASDTIRMSFIELVDETNALDHRADVQLNQWIFDPSGDEMRGYGKSYGAYSYFIQVTHHYMDIPTESPDVVYHLTEPDPTNPYVTYDTNSLLTTLQASDEVDDEGRVYYKGKVRINVWVEGWDADTFDAVDSDRVKIQLQFKSTRFMDDAQ